MLGNTTSQKCFSFVLIYSFILTVKVVLIEPACWLWVTDWLTDVENAVTNPEFSKSSFFSSCLKLGYLHDGVDILLLL